jgi:U3 small nucleolar RNA-associated protein 12
LDVIQSSKILGFLLKTHHNEIVANPGLRPYLELIKNTNKKSLKVTKDKIGINLYGLQALLRQKESLENCYFPSAEAPEEIEGKGAKRKIAVRS